MIDGVGRLLGSYVTKKSRAFTVLPFLRYIIFVAKDFVGKCFVFRGNFSHNRNKPLMQLQNSHFELFFGNSVVSVNKDGKLLKIKD